LPPGFLRRSLESNWVAASAAGATDTIGFAFRIVASGKIAQRATTSAKFSELRAAAEAFGDSWLGGKAEWIGLAPTVLLLIVLLPKLGILGAAFASVVGYGIHFPVMAWGFSRKNLGAKQAAISNSVPGRKTLPT